MKKGGNKASKAFSNFFAKFTTSKKKGPGDDEQVSSMARRPSKGQQAPALERALSDGGTAGDNCLRLQVGPGREYSTILDAIDESVIVWSRRRAAGEVNAAIIVQISIAPGHYTEMLPIPSGLKLEIVGEGDAGAVRISFYGAPVIVWGDPHAAATPSPKHTATRVGGEGLMLPVGDGNLKLKNLTLQSITGQPPFPIAYSTSSTTASANSSFSAFTIDAYAPNLFIDSCTVLSLSHGCVRAMGYNTNLHAMGSDFGGGQCSSIVVGSGASAVLENCCVGATGGAEKEVPGGRGAGRMVASATSSPSRTSPGGGGGQDGRINARSSVDADKIGSEMHAIEICGGASLITRQCAISSDKGDGIFGYGDGTSVICTETIIHRCRGNGIEVKEKAEATLRRCIVRQCREAALCIHSSGGLESAEDLLSGNEGHGVVVGKNGGGRVSVKEGKIIENKVAGIFVYGGSEKVAVERSSVMQNGRAGIAVEGEGSSVVVKKSEIVANKEGIACFSGSNAIIRDAIINQNEGCGVLIDNSKLQMTACNLTENVGGGIVVGGEKALADIETAIVTLTRAIGVEVAHKAKLSMANSNILRSDAYGLLFHHDSEGKVANTQLKDNATFGVAVFAGGKPTVSKCTIEGNKEGGVSVSKKGQGVFESNGIYRNGEVGVVCSTGAKITFSKNTVSGHSIGLNLKDTGGGLFCENDLRGNKEARQQSVEAPLIASISNNIE
uniref:Right handed beta helix domain-containing protein n=1 Tax=Palpitomonas bilix TaxID=652834 RepID=A0A7S3DB55_9EUKA|mmetsp:Transcript_29603/g.76475  ORF Transcript_29603/g.76475 Transcript_29603/m.76475 type:complete len:726 (+) Transcript_29603:243-2420(+)